tara:strand:- start:1450 stop:2658 length:1209 start_codon:yes stop_codon:yes gene_type:complete
MGEYLFHGGSLFDHLRALSENVLGEIERLNSDYLLGASENDLIAALYAKNELDCPKLLSDEIYIHDQTEATRNRSDYGRQIRDQGTHITIAVPYEGDQKFFHFEPSTSYVGHRPQADIRDGELHLDYFTSSGNSEVLKNQYEKDVAEIAEYLQWVEDDLKQHNNNLTGSITRAVANRKNRLLRDQNVVANLGLPIKRRGDSKKTFAVPDIRRKPSVRMPVVKDKTFAPEPIWPEEEYDYVLGVIRSSVNMMERSPSVFSQMDEESLRDQILVQLNGHYEGNATGETFNASGKTDILIRHEDRNVFIGECKIWKGSKALMEAIDQLLGYTSWRDTKTSLIIFNKNKNHSTVVEAISETVPDHTSCKKLVEKKNETEFRYLFGQPDDPNRELHLTVQAFHVPKD